MKERTPDDPNYPPEIPNRENPDKNYPDKAPDQPDKKI